MKQLAEVVVQKVWPLAPDKKWTNFTAATGDKYFGPPGIVNQFSEGETCKVEWEPSGKDGTLKKIVRKVGGVPANPMPKQMTRPAAAPREARQIGIFAAAKLVQPVPFGTVDEMTHALTAILIAASRSYDRVLAAAQTQAADDLDDAIPF